MTTTVPGSKTLSPGPGTQTAPEFRRTLTAPRIALLVVAAAAPLGAMIGNVPLGILLGNGAGLPAAFAIAGLLIACLATGYLAMSREVPEAGGFAALVRVGLGPKLGQATAFATATAYAAGTIALAVGTGYFSNLIFSGIGIDLPWWAWSGIAVVVVGFLGQRAADLSSRVLVVLMVAEFAVLAIVDVAILVQHGLAALPLESFSPAEIFSGNIGPALMIAFTSFIGIESAILYTKEARNPGRSITRATQGAIAVIGVFYVLTVWLFIGSVGASNAVAEAAEHHGDFVFVVTHANAGGGVVTVMQIFFCTSLLACMLALHNAGVRYIHTLATQRALPGSLGRLHERHNGPHRASLLLTALTVVVVVGCALSGADPYLGVGSSLTGLFTVGVVGLQALVAAATIVYFRRKRDSRIWGTLIAPAIGGVGIAAAVALIIVNYPLLTNSDSPVVNALPVIILVAGIAGAVVEARRSTS